MTGPELILGKLLPYFFVGMADVAVAVAMGTFLFRVPFRGSVPLLFGFAALFLASDESRWITGVILPVDGGLGCTSAQTRLSELAEWDPEPGPGA